MRVSFLFFRSTVVDIGGCILRYFSLGESMAAGNEVCTYVVNALCRNFFMDERPTVSKKHYFFCFVAVSVSINIPLTHVYMFSFHVQLFLFFCL